MYCDRHENFEITIPITQVQTLQVIKIKYKVDRHLILTDHQNSSLVLNKWDNDCYAVRCCYDDKYNMNEEYLT